MRKKLLDILACPHCEGRQKLIAEADEETRDHIMAGALICENCETRYLVAAGVPNLLIGKHSQSVQKGFSSQWKLRAQGKFERQEVVYLYRHEDMVKRMERNLGEDILNSKDQWILNAGCGSGEKVAWFARQHPDLHVVGMDFSDSVAEAAELYSDIPNLDFVQGDVNHPPFAQESFMAVISIGVLHHTADTKKAFDAVAGLVARGGVLDIWLYPHPSEGGKTWKTYYLVRDVVFMGVGHRLPPRLRYWLVRSLFLWAAFLPKSKRPQGHGADLSPIDYYNGISFSIFDDITPKYQHRHKREEVFGWYREHGFGEVKCPDIGAYYAVKN